MGVSAVLLLYTWLAPRGSWAGREERVLRDCAGVVLAMVACFVARHTLPQHPRPRLALPLDFPSIGTDAPHLMHIKAFPSDTACLAAALTVTIFLASKRLGWYAAAWSVFAICFTRAYVGYHYLSDLVVGATIGAIVPLMATSPRFLPLGSSPRVISEWQQKNPALAVVVLALVAHQIGGMFPLLQLLGAKLRVW